MVSGDLMGQGKAVEPHVLNYLKEKEGWVTFKELYFALEEASKQGIRNCIYRLEGKGTVERSLAEKRKGDRSRIKFKLKQL